MKAIVTGCAGFIGSHLCERLIAEGFDVVGIDAFTPYYDRQAKQTNLGGLRTAAGFSLVESDLNQAPLESIFRGASAIFHLAAQPGVRASFGEGFYDYVQDNVVATQRVFEAALAAGARRVVMASSSSVYGDAETYPCIEDVTPTAPRSPYGVSKRTCEDLAYVYGLSGLEVVAMRYFTVYGPRQRPDMAFRRLCEAIDGGDTFQLFGDGTQSRDFTYVTDVVDATFRSAFTRTPPPLVNVGGGQEATMNEVIDLLGRLADSPVPVERHGVQRGDVIRTAADTTKARTKLGWTPKVTLAEGLAAELAWVRAKNVADRNRLVAAGRL